jgi:putative phosphoribosyl transferase
MRYANRQDAGKRLAEALRPIVGADKALTVLALPRGGIVPGAEVASAFNAPLGVVLVRKIGHPANAEYAIGAVAEGAEAVYNEAETMGIANNWLKTAEDEAHELNRRRSKLYYHDIQPPSCKARTVVLVDDGIATGMTMAAAVLAVRSQQPKRLVVAVPVASRESVAELESVADKVVVLDDPDDFLDAVGSHYDDFPQVEDDEVVRYLREANNG